MAGEVVAVVGIVILLGGLALAYQGYKRWEISRLVSKTPTTPAGELDSTGLVELEGEVVADESMDSPIRQDENTVLSAWELEEYEEDDDSSGWKNRGMGITANPFYIDDGTGQALVDIHGDVTGDGDLLYGDSMLVDGAGEGLQLDNIITEFETFEVGATVDADEQTPDHIEEFVTYQPNIRPQINGGGELIDMGNASGDRRYYEGTIQAGDSVYVLGRAVPRDDATEPLGPEDLVVEPPTSAEDYFILSDLGEDGLLSRTRRGVVRLVVGGGVGLLGLFVVFSGAIAML